MKLEDTDVEIWKDIDGLEGEYAISSKGRVKNLKSGRIFTGYYDIYGYKYVRLKHKHYTIHRLVALAFLDNPDNLPQVNHIDERKDNNDVSNLAWCTASENVRHSIHHKSCRINQLTLDGDFVKVWDSSMQIGRETGYYASTIIKVCKGKQRSAYGYKWEYADTSQQHKLNRPVAVLTKDGEFVAEYKSPTEASRCLKIKPQSVSRCLNGMFKSTHGLKFIYIDN